LNIVRERELRHTDNDSHCEYVLYANRSLASQKIVITAQGKKHCQN
jgi:hypothetical protein